MISVTLQPTGHRIAQTIHEITHFRSIVHVQHSVHPQLGLAEDAVQGLVVRVVI